MWWKRKSAAPAPPPEPSPRLAEEVFELRADLKALRRDVDDLDETLRSLRGRVTKSAALEEKAHASAAPANGAALAPRPRAAPFDVVAVRRSGGGGPARGG